MDKREQMLSVLFSSNNLNESKENLDENFITNAVQNAGTAIKHAAQNAANDVRNSFAITAKQKAQANARTQALQAQQQAEKEGNKMIQQASKAGKASYKSIMQNWSQQNVKAKLDNWNKAFDSNNITYKDTVEALEYILCSINVLGVGGDNNAKAQSNVDNANNAKNANSQAMENSKQSSMNAAANGQQQESINWSQGIFANLLQESQGTKEVKTLINAIENSYGAYEGLKAKGDVKNATLAKENVKKAIGNVIGFITKYADKLTDKGVGQKMGGPLDKNTLDTFISKVRNTKEVFNKLDTLKDNKNDTEQVNKNNNVQSQPQENKDTQKVLQSVGITPQMQQLLAQQGFQIVQTSK